MKVGSLFRKQRPEGTTAASREAEWLEELLECRAKENDNELRHQLLKELIFKYAAAERELVRLNDKLLEKQKHLDEDLRAAAEIQKSLLPGQCPQSQQLQVAWKFLPCQLIGGDIFNLARLDDNHFGVYMIDVSGHGVPSALVTVSLSQVLQPDGGLVRKARPGGESSGYEISSPQAVLTALDEQYPMERFDMFFTMVYAVLDVREGLLRYGKAGHPPPLLLHADGDLELLNQNGPIVGLGGVLPFTDERKPLVPGDKIFFYTDGIVEYAGACREFYGKERFYAVLTESRNEPVAVIVERVIESMLRFGDHCEPEDDVSLLAIEYLGTRPEKG